MSHYFTDDECNECVYYVRQMYELTEWQCIQCGIKEMEGMVPSRYGLACGHEVHIRCYRKWCKEKNAVGCCECGQLEKKEEHKFCTMCDVFHCTMSTASYHAIQ